MNKQSGTSPAENTQRLISLVQNKYTQPEQREHAMNVLAALGLISVDIQRQIELARIRQWKIQCNAIVSYKEREHSDEWLALKQSKEIDEELEDWIIGKPIGTIEQNMLIIVINSRAIPVMSKEDAEMMAKIMEFESLDAFFTLKYSPDTNEMVINALRTKIRIWRTQLRH